jgi:myosin heavy subunit
MTGAQARANVDSLAQGLFSKLFLWIVSKINESLALLSRHTEDVSTSAFRRPKIPKVEPNHLTLLDMMGFEDHRRLGENCLNGFEQFLVNYCNERLHSVFYLETFSQDNSTLTEEGCPSPWTPFGYDNSECISLYEGERGLLKLIDEHCLLSRAGQDDFALLALFCNTISALPQKKQTIFSCSLLLKKRVVTSEDTFVVKHYASTGDGTRYCVQGFTARNVEPAEMEESLKQSSNAVLALSLRSEDDDPPLTSLSETARNTSRGGGGAAGGVRGGLQRQGSVGTRKIKKTKCQSVKTSLGSTLSDLNNTQLHFIRCLRVSDDQSPPSAGSFDPEVVLQQLRASGVFDAIQMTLKGYTHRSSWKDLLRELVECGCLSSTVLKSVTDPREYLRRYLGSSRLDPSNWFEGKSGLVFAQPSLFHQLKLQRFDLSAGLIQRNWRVQRLSSQLSRLSLSLGVVKRSLVRYLLRRQERIRRERQWLSEQRALPFLSRWRHIVRLRKRTSVWILIRVLRQMRVTARIKTILGAQEIIANLLQTKRLRGKYLNQKKAITKIQARVRGCCCRGRCAPLIAQVREQMYRRLCDLSVKKIIR